MGCERCGIPRQKMNADEAVQMVERMLGVLAKKTNLQGDIGGVFCAVKQDTREYTIPPTPIGIVLEQDKCNESCTEQANRLCEMHASDDHWLSWQSRDVDAGKWGGAIHDGEYVWSFSGMPEAFCEALMLTSAQMCGRIMNGAPAIYAETSSNSIILEGEYLFWARD